MSERDASKPALNEIKKPEKRPEDDTTSFAIGFAGRGRKHCSRLHETANTSSTLWENFQEHVKDEHEEVIELREIGYEDSSNSDQETEEEEENCDGATRPAVYKCAAAYFSEARKDVILSHAEWHKPISEVSDHLTSFHETQPRQSSANVVASFLFLDHRQRRALWAR